MTKLLLPAVLGLLLGLLLHWSCLSRPWRSPALTFLSGVTALGWTLLGVAVLTWLAVLPPDSPGTLTWLLLRWSLLFALSALPGLFTGRWKPCACCWAAWADR